MKKSRVSLPFVCYDANAKPPIDSIPRTGVTTANHALTSADGTRIAAFGAYPDEPAGPGVLVLPDNRGLSGFYEKLAVHLAGQGHPTLAVDYFARTAGIAYAERGPEFADLATLMPHLRGLSKDTLYADVDAALDHLRQHAGTLTALGFCMGGRFAYLTAAARFGLSGVVGFYGFPDALNGAAGPLQLASDLTAPILAIWGGADEGIPPALIDTFDKALTEAGTEHEFVTYDGAPHGFFELGQQEHRDACADAWRRTLEFLATR
jgi:carboxymethylenebutenolidase